MLRSRVECRRRYNLDAGERCMWIGCMEHSDGVWEGPLSYGMYMSMAAESAGVQLVRCSQQTQLPQLVST